MTTPQTFPTEDKGRARPSATGSRASHRASKAVSTKGFDPARMMLAELNRGIANVTMALAETEASDTFWYRYWAGYLKGYECLRDKLRTAIATEARRAETSGSVEDEGAGLKGIAQGPPA